MLSGDKVARASLVMAENAACVCAPLFMDADDLAFRLLGGDLHAQQTFLIAEDDAPKWAQNCLAMDDDDLAFKILSDAPATDDAVEGPLAINKKQIEIDTDMLAPAHFDEGREPCPEMSPMMRPQPCPEMSPMMRSQPCSEMSPCAKFSK